MARKPPRWYFSLRSPYWSAYHDLLSRYPDVADTIEWIPFWEPDEQTQELLDADGVRLSIVEMSRAKNFYILQDTRRLAEARGPLVTWPVDRDPNWKSPTSAIWWRRRPGWAGSTWRSPTVPAGSRAGTSPTVPPSPNSRSNSAWTRARWPTPRDDPAVRRRGADTLIRSHKDGLFGVPFFIHGHDKYFGVDRLRAYVAKARLGAGRGGRTRLAGQAGPLPVTIRAGGDAGHAGGCG